MSKIRFSSQSLSVTICDGVTTDVKVRDFIVTGFSAGVAQDVDGFGASVIEIHDEFRASMSAAVNAAN